MVWRLALPAGDYGDCMPDLRRPFDPFLPASEIPDSGNPYLPAARPVDEVELATATEPRLDLLAVYVRTTGRSRPTVLTGWRKLDTGEWVARVVRPRPGGGVGPRRPPHPGPCPGHRRAAHDLPGHQLISDLPGAGWSGRSGWLPRRR